MDINGYRVSFTSDTSKGYDHKFGGNDWETPVCQNCYEHYHQILSLDLRDPKLCSIIGEQDMQFPLISCLNCSSNWGEQIFRIDFRNKQVIRIGDDDTFHWVEDEELKLVYPLPEFKVSLDVLSNEEAENIINDFGSKYFITVLGTPAYLYSDDYYNTHCPVCGGEMKYTAAVCSDFVNILKEFDFKFGEQWLLYFFCRHCNIMKVIGQST